MDSQRTQISVTKLKNSKETADYQRFVFFTKGSQWAHYMNSKGLKEF